MTENKVKPLYTVSPDPNLEAKSYGLAIASEWLSTDQITRVKEILQRIGKSAENPDTTGESTKTTASPLTPQEHATSSPAVADSSLKEKPLGGIDFRNLPVNIQPIGSFNGLNFKLPHLSQSELEQINADSELQQINNMVKAGITPSGERIKELIALCAE